MNLDFLQHLLRSPKSHGENWEARVQNLRPRLLLFDDSPSELKHECEFYESRGYEAIGVSVLHENDAGLIGPDSILDQDKVVQQRWGRDKYASSHYAVSNAEQLAQLIEQLKPAGVISDMAMHSDWLKSPDEKYKEGNQLLAELNRIAPDLPKAIHTGGEITNDDKKKAAAGGYIIGHKMNVVDMDKIETHFHLLPDKKRPKVTIICYGGLQQCQRGLELHGFDVKIVDLEKESDDRKALQHVVHEVRDKKNDIQAVIIPDWLQKSVDTQINEHKLRKPVIPYDRDAEDVYAYWEKLSQQIGINKEPYRQ